MTADGERGSGEDDADAEAEPAVDARNVSVSLGDATVLDGVDLRVERGELLGLVGPNGAGKTTLLRTVSGALAPDGGRVLVGGDDVHDLASAEASRRVAVVPQETHLSFSFAVRDVVEMGRYPHQSRFGTWTREDRRRVEDALDRTRTAAFADRSIDEVSGGERQRVLLARALAQDAPVLLLDEPTASLDLNHAVETMELVREFVSEGKSAVAAIHDLELAARYCDRLALVSEGDVVATGPPEAVLGSERIEAAFDARTAIEPAPVGGLSIAPLPDREAGPRVHVVGGGDPAAEAIGALGSAGTDLSIGPVPRGDRAIPTARSFDATVVETPPFEAIDGDALDRARDLAAEADACVLAADRLDDGAAPWLSAIEAADAAVVVADAPPTERVSPDLRERFADLRRRGTVATADDVDEAVRAAADAEADADSARADGGDDAS